MAVTGEDPGAGRALRLAEAQGERAASFIRIAILVAVLAAVVAAQSAGFDHGPLVTAVAVYGAGTLAGVVLALRRIYRPWFPYAFVGLDMVTLAMAILLLGRMLDLPAPIAMGLPVAGLVVVVLLHASMHYRPRLVLFGILAFAAAMAAGALAFDIAFDGAGHAHARVTEHLDHLAFFPPATLGLATVILILTTRRTRRFISEAFVQAGRAATLSRYFSPEVVEELTGRTGTEASSGARMDVAVIFADVRGFTAMAEAMDPAELASFLSEFRARIAAPALANGGVVDKYIGDAIMVVFGAPRTRDDDAARALRTAVEMFEAMHRWSQARQRRGAAPVHVGIGAHCGQAFAGVLSDGRQLEYTVIGDTVNVASRLADLAPRDRTAVVVSADLAGAAGGLAEPWRWTEIANQELPGHPRTITVLRLE